MCMAFSHFQNINKATMDPDVVRAELEKARVHLQWHSKQYRKQLERNALFLHENLAYAIRLTCRVA